MCPPLPVPPPLSLALCLSLCSLNPSLSTPAPGACPVARLTLGMFWRNIWISGGAQVPPRLPEGAEMARPEDAAVPRGTCLALHSPSPSLHPVKPPGLPRACQQFPGGFLTSFCRVCSHLFRSAQTCFSSAWQEGFVGCSCFYFPPLLPLRRR